MLQDLRYAFCMIRRHPRSSVAIIGTLFFVFAVIALGIAIVGSYAVIAHATSRRTREIGVRLASGGSGSHHVGSRRTREIGVRLALGAGTGTIVRMVLNRGPIQIGVGMTIGLTAAFFICRLMESLLLKVSPSDPITFGAVGLTLFSAGLAACLIPARRASRLDPLVALRNE